MKATNTPEQIGKARAAVIDYIENQPCCKNFAINRLNERYAAKKLPKKLHDAVNQAWLKPRECILKPSTYDHWVKNVKERGHHRPLIRQKDTSIKPWHELARELKKRNPKRKTTLILTPLNEQYPDVSYWALQRFFNATSAELGAL
jgi:hypothetical protein